MAVKELKKAGGIALRPALWERVERLARHRKTSKSAVMEAVLELYLPDAPDFGNQRESSPADEIPWETNDAGA